MYIMYKLVKGGPSCEAYCCTNKLAHLSQYPLVGISGREYQIQFIYEYIFCSFHLASLHAAFVKLKKNVTGEIEKSRLVKRTKPAFLLDS